MAGPCFWRDPLNLVQDCGGDPEPTEWHLGFTNNIMFGDNTFFWEAPGFVQGADFQLSIPSDLEVPVREMRYNADYDYYTPYFNDRVAPFNGSDRTPGAVMQGGNQWPVVVSVIWS